MDDNNDTMVLKPRRVYKCDSENRMMERKDVWKDHNGEFHCTSCNCRVRDVTNTITGHDFMELVRI